MPPENDDRNEPFTEKDRSIIPDDPPFRERLTEGDLEDANPSDDPSPKGPIAVGIVSSVVDTDPLCRILSTLPADDDIAYIVVHPTALSTRSTFAEDLAGHAPMDVQEIKHGGPIQPGVFYLQPPGADVILDNGRFRLQRVEETTPPGPAIDLFFASLAEEFGPQAVAVVLSGAGNDGAHGIRAVKAVGGLTMAQDPGTSRFGAMPRAAIESGHVDLVLAPEVIGTELNAFLRSRRRIGKTSPLHCDQDDLARLLGQINRRTGCDFTSYKQNTIARRVGRRIALQKLSDLKEYLSFVSNHPQELDLLANDLLLSVTRFFRDRNAFKALGEIIPEILGAKDPRDGVRVWVPGCATGEEAYSIALLFATHLGKRFERYNLQIFATDIDTEAIAYARRGIYPEASLYKMDRTFVDTWFTRDSGQFQIAKTIRERLIFARQDLIKDPPFSHQDLISCRNLLIYFNAAMQERLLRTFHYALNPEGTLFLGKSESLGQSAELFTPTKKRWRIFRRKESMRASVPYFAKIRARVPCIPPADLPNRSKGTLKEAINQAIADAVGFPAVLIDEHSEIVHVRGDVNRYLQFVDGDAGLHIVDLAPQWIRSNLRSAIHKARRQKATVSCPRIRLPDSNAGDRCLNLRVHPVTTSDAANGMLLVLFEEIEAIGPCGPVADENDDFRDQRLVDLEQELSVTSEHLQTTTEELETTTEELQSLNEELQSANEELQSTNEELETSNEELQVSNEELAIVNEELQVKTAELYAANDDLENILMRMGLAMLVVNRQLRIKRFTPPATAIFNLMPGDRGQVLTKVGTYVDIPNLQEIIEEAIENGTSATRSIDAGTKYYEMSVHPYYDQGHRINGAILTFYDKTEIHRREQEFRALAENAPDIIVRFDRDLRHRYVNQAVEKYNGRNKAEFIDKTLRDMGLAESVCRLWEERIRKVFHTGHEVSMEFELTAANGPRAFEARLVPEYTSDGMVATVLGISRDVTERKESERVLSESEARLSAILESINDGFLTLSDDLKVTYFNKASERLLGREREEVIGKNFFDAFEELRGSIFEIHYRQALENKKGVAFETYFDVAPYANWYDVRIYPFDSGISVYFNVTTERKEAEESVRESERRLASLIQSIQAGVAVYNREGVIAHSNAEARVLLGLRYDEVQGQMLPAPDWKFFLEDGRPMDAEDCPVSRVLSTGLPISDYVIGIKRNELEGTQWALVNVIPERDADHTLTGVIVTSMDITERKRLETQLRQAQKLQAVGTLAGGIAHEFNNLLGIIIGNAELAIDQFSASDARRQFLNEILKAGLRGSNVVKQLLSFSRKSNEQKRRLDISPLLKEALKMLKSSIPKDIEFQERITDTPRTVFADPTQINQLMINLCTNAAHAMHDSGGTLTVGVDNVDIGNGMTAETEEDMPPGAYVRITVTDTGHGIAPDHLDRIFDPFFTTKAINKGTGLGLAVVHGIVKGHKGYIRVCSKAGEGTEFQIYFPGVDASAEPEYQQVPTELPTGTERVLLVDDEESIVRMACRQLERLGYRVTSRTGSLEARDLFARDPERYDLVITDMTMPKMTGDKLIAELRRIRSDIGIIICTGFSERLDRKKALAIGADAFIMKPIDRFELARTVREVLDQRTPPRSAS